RQAVAARGGAAQPRQPPQGGPPEGDGGARRRQRRAGGDVSEGTEVAGPKSRPRGAPTPAPAPTSGRRSPRVRALAAGRPASTRNRSEPVGTGSHAGGLRSRGAGAPAHGVPGPPRFRQAQPG